MEISKPINLDEESLVSHFVDGIPDSKINKAGLYRANLKKKYLFTKR